MRYRVFFCLIGLLMIFNIGCASRFFSSSPLARIQGKSDAHLRKIAELSARTNLNRYSSEAIAEDDQQPVFAENWAYVDPEFQSLPEFEDDEAIQLAASDQAGNSRETWKPSRRWASAKSR